MLNDRALPSPGAREQKGDATQNGATQGDALPSKGVLRKIRRL